MEVTNYLLNGMILQVYLSNHSAEGELLIFWCVFVEFQRGLMFHQPHFTGLPPKKDAGNWKLPIAGNPLGN